MSVATVGPTGPSSNTTTRSPGTKSPPSKKPSPIGPLEIVGSCLAAVVFLLVISFGVYYVGFRERSHPEVWTELGPGSPPPGPDEAAAEVAAVTAAAAGPRDKVPEVSVVDGPGLTEKVPSDEDPDRKMENGGNTEHKQEGDGFDNVGFSEDSAL